MKKIMNSGIEDCIFKIIREKEKSEYNIGTGFFCKIPSKNIKVLITNNHILDQNFLDNEKKLKYIIDTENKKYEKEINLEIDRYKYTDINLDISIIEILPDDNITNFLEIDDYIDSLEYKEEIIFSVNYPKGKELKISMGEYLYKDKIYFGYSTGEENGESGGPIILYDNMKIIGLHKESKKNTKNNINIGISFNYIINKINFIKCIYNITDIKNDIKLMNDIIYKNNLAFKVNEEIENKIKINLNGKISPIIFKTKFKKKGKYTIYFISNEPIENLSCLFYKCKFLEEINLLSFNTNYATDMSGMFNKCSLLKELNLSSFNTYNVKDMSSV